MKLDFSVMKNPWVLGAGVVIGVIILTTGKSGGGTSNTASDFNGLAAASINANAQIAAANANATAQSIAALGNYLSNSQQVEASQQVANLQIMAGVRQSQFEQMNAYLMDLADNSARLGAAYIAGNVANKQTRASVDIARLQAGAAMVAAREAADASKFNSVVGGVTSVLTGGLKLLGGKAA